MPVQQQVQYIHTAQGCAYVIDSVFDQEALQWIDDFRLALPLDGKRPTVDRRFFADGPIDEETFRGHPAKIEGMTLHPERPMAHLLETAIRRALSSDDQTVADCHIFRYQRFLEYTKAGSKLDPHTDGTKVCDDTKKVSTHTLLLYLTDCTAGGETVLLKECTKELPQSGSSNDSLGKNDDGDSVVIYATQPRRGRILLFPHATPHAGATVVSVPKICLRAEVTLVLSQSS